MIKKSDKMSEKSAKAEIRDWKRRCKTRLFL